MDEPFKIAAAKTGISEKPKVTADASRRAFIQNLLAVTIVAPIHGRTSPMETSRLTAKEAIFLEALADTIIPATETPGALAAGVPAILGELFCSWASPDTKRRWRTVFARLQNQLNGPEGSFIALSPAQRFARLKPLDQEIFSAADHPLKDYLEIKSTIAESYYLSKPGATIELRYHAIPGVWNACTPVGKTWATDG